MVASWRPDLAIQVAFNADPNSSDIPIWSDLSNLWTGATGVKRGRQYELDQNQAAQPTMTWIDPDEWLNPTNDDSPYAPGVVPLRQILWQAMWPNTADAAGNLLNSNQGADSILATDDSGYDPSFESYTAGDGVPWIGAVGGTTPVVGTTTPHAGDKDLTFVVIDGDTTQGVSWTVPCIPGRKYTSSAWVRQSAASTLAVSVDGLTAGIDVFNRTEIDGWGSAQVGGPWTVSGAVADYAVANGTASIICPVVDADNLAYLNALSAPNFNASVLVGTPSTPTGDAIIGGLLVRYVAFDNSWYLGTLSFQPDAPITLTLSRRVSGTDTVLDSIDLPAPFTPNTWYGMRLIVNDSTLTLSAWLDSIGEAQATTLTATDTSIGTDTFGVTGCYASTGADNTNTDPTLLFASFNATNAVYSTSTTTTGSWVRLANTFTASQPFHTVSVVTVDTAMAATVLVDDIQHEQTNPIGVDDGTFTAGVADWAPLNSGSTVTGSTTQSLDPGGASARLVCEGASATQDGIRPADKTTVTAGDVYQVDLWAYSVAGFGDDTHAAIDWYDADGTYLSTSSGEDAVIPAGAWTLFSVAATAPDTAASCLYGPTLDDPADGTTVFFDNVFLYGPPATFTTSGPSIWGVFRGYVERWPSQWDNQGFLGLCETTCVDAFEAFNLDELNSEYRMAVLASNPNLYWPLNDGAGTTTYGEQSGNNGPSLVNFASPFGEGSAPIAGSAIGPLGDPTGTGVLFTPTGTTSTGTVIGYGAKVNHASGFEFPAGQLGAAGHRATLACWVVCAPQTGAQTIIQTFPPSTAGELTLSIGVAVGGTLAASVGGAYDGSFLPIELIGTSITITDGLPHLLMASVTQGTSMTSLSAWVDGVGVTGQSVPTSSVGGLLTTGSTSIVIGGLFAYGTYSQMLAGTVSHIALWWDEFPDATTLWNAGGLGNRGELSGTRVQRYVDAAGTWFATNIQDGSSTMGASTVTPGTPILAACQAVGVSEQGNFVVDKDGAPTFFGRMDRYLATASLWTFGEHSADGELPYEESIDYDLDPTFVTNIAVVQNADGITATVVNGPSKRRYFPRTTPLNVNLDQDEDAIQLAYWIVNTHDTAIQRVNSATLDPAGNPDLWAPILTMEVNDRITVIRRPKAANGGAGITMTGDFFVESISHDTVDMASNAWTTTLLLSPAEETSNVWILGDTTWGVLGSTTRLAY